MAVAERKQPEEEPAEQRQHFPEDVLIQSKTLRLVLGPQGITPAPADKFIPEDKVVEGSVLQLTCNLPGRLVETFMVVSEEQESELLMQAAHFTRMAINGEDSAVVCMEKLSVALKKFGVLEHSVMKKGELRPGIQSVNTQSVDGSTHKNYSIYPYGGVHHSFGERPAIVHFSRKEGMPASMSFLKYGRSFTEAGLPRGKRIPQYVYLNGDGSLKAAFNSPHGHASSIPKPTGKVMARTIRMIKQLDFDRL